MNYFFKIYNYITLFTNYLMVALWFSNCARLICFTLCASCESFPSSLPDRLHITEVMAMLMDVMNPVRGSWVRVVNGGGGWVPSPEPKVHVAPHEPAELVTGYASRPSERDVRAAESVSLEPALC